MTCGLAVKRPHDYEAYLGADVEAKRPRPTASHCSPFRPQLGTLAATLPNSSGGASPRSSTSGSPFALAAGKVQLSHTQLDDYLRNEVRYLKRRSLIPRRHDANSSDSHSNADDRAKTTTYRRGGTSPTPSHSGSDSEGENTSSAHGTRKMINELYERPQFSMNQVKLICERLLKEQESRLRYEYETVLNCKLEEKHEQYVQFAKEQLENRPSSAELSYLS